MAVARTSKLYQDDYYAWVQAQVRALRQRRIADVDWDNVAAEIEDLGKSEIRAIESQAARLLEHLLKLCYASRAVRTRNARGWQLSIADARLVTARLLAENPSLRPQLPDLLSFAYQRARLAALRKLRLPDEQIPESMPWTVAQVMGEKFLPDGG